MLNRGILGNNADSSWVLRCGMDCVRCFGDVRRHLFGAGHGGRFFLIMGKSLFAVLIFSSFACALKYYLIGYLEINIYVSLLMALMLLLPMLFAFLFVFERGHILKLKECVHGSGR